MKLIHCVTVFCVFHIVIASRTDDIWNVRGFCLLLRYAADSLTSARHFG